MVDGEEVEDVVEFTYLGAIVDKEGEGNHAGHYPPSAKGTRHIQETRKGLGS